MGLSNADYQLPGSVLVDSNLVVRKNGATAIEFVLGGTVLITLVSDGTVYLPGGITINGNGIVDVADGSTILSKTAVGFFGVPSVGQQSANPDTSGATLGQLETEVNELKALLRNVGLMAT